MKKILITGAGGFVGKRLALKLAQQGHKIIAVLREGPKAEDSKYFEHENIQLLIQDLENLDVNLLPSQADALITLAQSARFREFPEQVQEVFSVNVTANLRLIEWAIGAGVYQVVHASSGGIYGGKGQGAFVETDLLAVDSPLGFYLGSKLCSEVVLQNFQQFFKSLIILRPFFIYGPGQREDMFIARLVKSVCDGTPISLQGDKGLQVNPIYVDDAVDAFCAALKLDGTHVLNIAGPDVVSLKEIGELIGKYVGKDPLFEMRSGIPSDYVGDILAATRKLDIAPMKFSKGIELYINERRQCDT